MAKDEAEADVCIAGAGFAGLTAARRLTQAGMTVVALEADERVGGRTWTQTVGGGAVVDRGGAWLAPGHEAAFRLAGEVGVSTYKTWVDGVHLLVGDGRVHRYKGLIPKISPLAVLIIALAQLRVDRLANKVPLDAPWTARRATEWDARTVASWIAGIPIRSSIGRDLFEMAVRGLFAADLDEVSYLDLLFLVHAHGTIEKLFSIDGGSQENLVDGGVGAVAAAVAHDLGGALHLGTPVRAVTQRTDRVLVESDRLTVTARYAVVTVPPALALDIAFDPALPEDRRTLYRRAAAGIETKTVVVYDEPFWRAEGFSGQSAEPRSAAEVTIDASPSTGTPGVLASFTFGKVAERVDAMSETDRRKAVLDSLVGRFGPRAAAPVEFVETAWWTQPWSRGCSMAHFPPGILTRFGPLLRQPFGRVHWAGTETATVSHGAIDGAIRSGERVAAEILKGRAGSSPGAAL